MMKKLPLLLVVMCLTATAAADLLDGDFASINPAGKLPSSGNLLDPTEADNGWEISAFIDQDALEYVKVGRSHFNTGQDYFFGQIWNDSLSAGMHVEFDVVFDSYSSGVTDPKVWIQIFGYTEAPGAKSVQLGSAAYTSHFTLLLDELVDVSGGVGSYSSGSDDLSGYSLYAIRVGLNGSGGGYGEDIGLDNFTIVPEPATMSLLAFGGLGVLLRRKR